MNGPDQIQPMPDLRVPRVRRRAPRRTGRRAQLTVPDGMWREVVQLAELAGTTPNDILVQLAAERLEERRHALECKRRGEERWQAFLDAATATPDACAPPLTERELVELSGAFRNDA